MNMKLHYASSFLAMTTLLAPISWGTTYVVITEFLPADRPLFIAACRLLPAGLVLVTLGTITQRAPVCRRDWKRLTVLSVFNFALFFPLLITAIYRLPGGVAASVGGLQPLLVAVVGWLIASITPRRLDLLIGTAAAIGVAMVVLRPGAAIDPIGVLAAVGANVSFSIGVVLTRQLRVSGDRITTTGIQLLLGSVVVAPLAIVIEGAAPSITAVNLAGVAYLSLFATGAAFVVWFTGIPRLPSQAPPVLGLAAPIVGAALGWILLDESLSGIQLSGFAITIGAIAYAATIGASETSPSNGSGLAVGVESEQQLEVTPQANGLATHA
jgi:probable blue pigment (indigoidine) exporter